MDSYRQFADGDAAKLEAGYQEYVQSGTPDLAELNVGNDVVVVVSFKYPMKQFSPANKIQRRVRRFVENAR